jgi:hypothetical protein
MPGKKSTTVVVKRLPKKHHRVPAGYRTGPPTMAMMEAMSNQSLPLHPHPVTIGQDRPLFNRRGAIPSTKQFHIHFGGE